MITPRRTRLVRVSDLHQFRKAIVALCERDDRAQAVLVPTHGAAAQLRRTFAAAGVPQLFAPDFVTRDGLYDALHARLDRPPRRLTAFERDALAQAAAAEAAALAGDLPFRIRPGLVAELLHFYDQLRRQSQQVSRFEELLTDALGGGHDEEAIDRGSARLLRQTRFLAEAFRGYERRVAESGACDEHTLRARLLAEQPVDGLQHLVVTVPDWIADPAGLFVADFDLLARVPGVEALDLVCTESILGSGFHERIHNWWPGLEEVEASAILGSAPRIRPTLSVPSAATPERWWFTHRDREEELLAVAARATEGDGHKAWDRLAIVFKRPLPYLYLAPQTLGAAKIPYLAVDALPLAAEPAVAIVDLVLDAVETRFTRESLIALLRCPHFDFSTETGAPSRESIARLNQDLAARRFLGGLDRLLAFDGEGESGAALRASQALGTELAPLLEPANASQQLRRLIAFIDGHLKPLDPADSFAAREQLARAAALDVLTRYGRRARRASRSRLGDRRPLGGRPARDC